MVATRSCSGAESLRTVVPNSRPSRQLITATPCTPMSPLTITTSPTVARSGRMSTSGARTPMPAVFTKTPSPLPLSTTLVSPVTSLTPALAGRLTESLGHPTQLGQLGALRDDEGRGEEQRCRPGHRQVVDRAVDGKVADRPTREEHRLDHVRVRREGEPDPAHLDDGGVTQLGVRGRRRTRAGTGARSALPTSRPLRRAPSRSPGCPARARDTPTS